MTNALANVAIETNPEAVYADFTATFERRKAAITARLGRDEFVIMWDNGLCVGVDASGKGFATGYEGCHFFATEAAAKAAIVRAELANGHGEIPEVVSAKKARFRSLGKVLYAMATLAEGMGK